MSPFPGQIARQAAPVRTRMEMPAHLAAMMEAPAKRVQSKPLQAVVSKPMTFKMMQRLAEEHRLKEEAEALEKRRRMKAEATKRRKLSSLLLRCGVGAGLEDGDRFRRGQMHIVCDYFATVVNMPVRELKSVSRRVCVTKPRQRLMWILSSNGPFSTPQIGRFFNRDHSTVVHAIQVVNRNPEQLQMAKSELQQIIKLFEDDNV